MKGREATEIIQREGERGMRKVIIQLAEEITEMQQHIRTLAEAIDVNATVLLEHRRVLGMTAAVTNKLRKRVEGVTVDSESPVDPVTTFGKKSN